MEFKAFCLKEVWSGGRVHEWTSELRRSGKPTATDAKGSEEEEEEEDEEEAKRRLGQEILESKDLERRSSERPAVDKAVRERESLLGWRYITRTLTRRHQSLLGWFYMPVLWS